MTKPYSHYTENPHLPLPHEKWLNVAHATHIATKSVPKLSQDARDRLLTYLEWDDIVQEVFLSMVRAARLYDPARGRLSTLLYTAAANRLRLVALNQSFVHIPAYISQLPKDDPYVVQAAKVKKLFNVDGMTSDPHKDEGYYEISDIAVFDDTNHQELIEHVRERLKRLTPEERQLLLDFYEGGKTLAEIGKARGHSGQYAYRLKRAFLQSFAWELGLDGVE